MRRRVAGRAIETIPTAPSGATIPARALGEPTRAPTDAAARERANEVVKTAKTRWLRNTEVCDVLLNYAAYGFEPSVDAPVRPLGGTLFLINRKVVRFFRKDGHNWQKKKDGKTIRETHEKLKVGTVELLNCYYTHSEEDAKFQRRCYWLLNMDEGAVLVHYLTVKKEPQRPSSGVATPGGAARGALGSMGRDGKRAIGSKAPLSSKIGNRALSSKIGSVASKIKSASTAGRRGAGRSRKDVELESFLDGAADDFSRQNVSDMLNRDDEDLALIFQETGLDDAEQGASEWKYALDSEYMSDDDAPATSLSRLMREFNGLDDEYDDDCDDGRARENSDQQTPTFSRSLVHSDSPRTGGEMSIEEFERRIERIRSQWQNQVTGDGDSTSMERIERQINTLEQDVERAMASSLQRASDDPGGEPSTSAGDADAADELSGHRANATERGDAENSMHTRRTSGIVRHVPATPSGVHVLWSIVDFTPSWDDVSGGAKVIITGNPLVELEPGIGMCCVFGTIAVPVEQLAPNVLKCYAPAHAPGVVSMFLVMESGNGHPVSEISSFEFMESLDPSRGVDVDRRDMIDQSANMSDRDFQMRLVQLLTTLGSDSSNSVGNDSGEKSGDRTTHSSALVNDSVMHMNALSALRAANRLELDPYNLDGVKNEELVVLLSGMLQARLKSVIVHENRRMKARRALPSSAVAMQEVEEVAKTGVISDKIVETAVEKTQQTHKALLKVAFTPSAYKRKDQTGLTLFHCCAALGIEWAVRAMCVTGVDLNHTDAYNRSALHWAVARGHEMVVATLLNYGAKSRSMCQWEGESFTPAELAVRCGYEGISAYISEANLASALENINLRNSGIPRQRSRTSRGGGVSQAHRFRRTILSDTEGSDSEEHSVRRSTRVNSEKKRAYHRRKTSRLTASTTADGDDSETEAAFVVKRAENARRSLLDTLYNLNVKPEFIDADIHARLGKRRGRRVRQVDVQSLMSELLTPVGDNPTHSEMTSPSRRPVLRARRAPKPVVGVSITNDVKGREDSEDSESLDDDEDEEAIQKNFSRIQTSLQSAHSRTQYLRLRRLTNQLRVELKKLKDDGQFSDDDDDR